MHVYGWLWILTLLLVVATLSCMTALLVEKGHRASCRPYFTPLKLARLAKNVGGDSCALTEFLMWCFLFASVALCVLAIGATLFAPRHQLVVVEE